MFKYNPSIHHRRSIRLKGYDYSKTGAYFITICVQDKKCLFGKITWTLKKIDTRMVLNDFGLIAHQQWEKLPQRFHNIELGAFQIMPNHMHGIIIITERVRTTLAVVRDVRDARDVRDDAKKNSAIIANTIRTTAKNNNTITNSNGASANNNDAIRNNNATTNMAGARAAGATAAGATVVGATARVAPTTTTIGGIVGAYKSLVANECLKLFISKHPNEIMGKLWQRDYYEHIIRNNGSHHRISQYIINNPKNWKGGKFYDA